MKMQAPRILLATNGSETTIPALEYGTWFAGMLNTSVDVLGIIESETMRSRVERLVEETRQRLEAQGVPHQVLFDKGRGSVVIARHTCEQEYLTVVGPLGRPAWRRVLRGRSFRRIMARTASPILYVPQKRIPLEKILLCMGGLEYAEAIAQITFQIAAIAKARVTILHVIEPVTLNYPLAQKVHTHRDNLMQIDTPQTRNLKAALNDGRQAGIITDLRLRDGNPVTEIEEEVRTGDYDMIALGSPYSAHSLRQMYMPNVTAEVAEAVNRPVLVARRETLN